MKSKNLNYAFNKEYAEEALDLLLRNKDIETGDEKNLNKEFLKIGVQKYKLPDEISEENGYSTFNLQVRYPGLLIGLGAAHSVGAKGEFGLGFTFDYVTGQPYIPGSSIKGLLRSAFDHEEYIKELTGVSNVKALENEIFEGVVDGEDLPLCLRDTFFDAFIDFEKTNDKDKTGTLIYPIDDESLTPHGKDPFAEPTPLTLVKVKPGVVFRFVFRLQNNGSINVDTKCDLFEAILKDIGIGAKTNVGFGVLDEINEKIICTLPKSDESRNESKPRGENKKRQSANSGLTDKSRQSANAGRSDNSAHKPKTAMELAMEKAKNNQKKK